MFNKVNIFIDTTLRKHIASMPKPLRGCCGGFKHCFELIPIILGSVINGAMNLGSEFNFASIRREEYWKKFVEHDKKSKAFKYLDGFHCEWNDLRDNLKKASRIEFVIGVDNDVNYTLRVLAMNKGKRKPFYSCEFVVASDGKLLEATAANL